MSLQYTTIVKGIAYTLGAMEKIISGVILLNGLEKKNLKKTLRVLENAIRKTIYHIEVDSNKYSDKEIAEFWKEAGERLAVIPNMTKHTNHIFQKEMYWNAGKSYKVIGERERISIKSMLLLAEKLRDRLEEK